jgi:SAP domain
MDMSEVLVLPQIGQTFREGGEIITTELTVYVPIMPDSQAPSVEHQEWHCRTSKTTKAQLQVYLKAYSLGTSGNRSNLIERLRTYAADKDQWTRYE